MPAIEVRHLVKRFGEITAVDDLSFAVRSGGITGFVGPNGSGKTTTLRAILGLVRPDSGEAVVDGKPYAELEHPARHVGVVLEAQFHPHRSARNHLRVVATAAGLPPDRVDAALDTVGLSAAAHRKVGGFSLGMRQRLGLATALLGEPRILVLDEPTNGLDPEGVHWLRAFLRSHADSGGTILVSSHLLAELALSADHVVIIKDGRLVVAGSVDEITNKLTSGIHVRTPDAPRLLEVLAARGIVARQLEGDEIVVDAATTEAVGAAIAQTGIVVYEMRRERRNLEDTFLELTATHQGETS